MKRVLALQHVWDDPPGYLGEIMDEYDIAYDVVNVEEMPMPDPTPYNAILALGGFQHVNADDKYPYFVPEKAWLRMIIERNMPYLGICLGGQLLANVLGAPVTRHSLTEMGFFEVQLTREGQNDPLFQGLPDYQQVFQWHEDTFALPQGAVLLASTNTTLNQAFRVGERAYALQYHIELTPSMLDTWLRYPDYRKEIIRVFGEDAPEAIEQERPKYYPIYREHTRIVFKNFLKMSGCL